MTYKNQPTQVLSREHYGSSRLSASGKRKSRDRSPGWSSAQKTRRYNGHSRGLSPEYSAGIPTLDDEHVRFLAERHDEEPSVAMKRSIARRIEAATAEFRSRHLADKRREGGPYADDEEAEALEPL